MPQIPSTPLQGLKAAAPQQGGGIDDLIAQRQGINSAVSGQPAPGTTPGTATVGHPYQNPWGPVTPDIRGGMNARYGQGAPQAHPNDIDLPAGGEAPMDYDELMRRANALAPPAAPLVK